MNLFFFEIKKMFAQFQRRACFFIVCVVCSFTFSFNVFSKEAYSSKIGKKLLDNLQSNKINFLLEISKEEDICLKLFLSGPCLEKLIIKHDSKVREFEIEKQDILTRVRRYEAIKRKEKRNKSLEKLNNKVN